jgi:hypothetical protein
MRKEKKKKEVFECGIGNAEFGKKKRRKRYLNAELGMRNAERKRRKRAEATECGMRNLEYWKQPWALCLFLFSAFRIPTSEFLTPYTINHLPF